MQRGDISKARKEAKAKAAADALAAKQRDVEEFLARRKQEREKMKRESARKGVAMPRDEYRGKNKLNKKGVPVANHPPPARRPRKRSSRNRKRSPF